jgi:hypothetical protein
MKYLILFLLMSCAKAEYGQNNEPQEKATADDCYYNYEVDCFGCLYIKKNEMKFTCEKED